MGKSWKMFIPCILICALFSGCGSVRAAEPLQPDLVSQIEVSYYNKDVHLLRTYTDTDKMDAVLFYLYSLSPYGRAEEDPERIAEPSCKITVILTSGDTRTYRQRGGRYLSVDCKPWQKIDPEKSTGLFPMLARMCSDSG